MEIEKVQTMVDTNLDSNKIKEEGGGGDNLPINHVRIDAPKPLEPKNATIVQANEYKENLPKEGELAKLIFDPVSTAEESQ